MKDLIQYVWNWCGRIAFYITWPLIWLYLRRTERTRVIIKAEGKVLLVKSWLGPGSYSLPGGGLHRGEDPADGAIRELQEETGIRLEPNDLKPAGHKSAKENGIPYTAVVFFCTLPRSSEPRRRMLELSKTSWVSINESQSRSDINTYTRQALRDIADPQSLF